MGSHDGAEICELVGLYSEPTLCNVWTAVYYGLMLVNGTSRKLADKTRKDLHAFFNDLGLRITADVNNHTVNFLDITINLQEGKFSPYRKPNNDPLYINRRSNHPPSIIKQLPNSICKRISTLSPMNRALTLPNRSTKMLSAVVITTSIYSIPTTQIPPTATHDRPGETTRKNHLV